MDDLDENIGADADAALAHPNSIRAFDTLGAFLEEDEWYPAAGRRLARLLGALHWQ